MKNKEQSMKKLFFAAHSLDIGGIESYEEFLEKYPEEKNLISENEFSRGISRGFLETGMFQLNK